ncbi:DUF5993 family protein [Nocardia sp. NPDC050712]|uniref:DUF5993 family protein n=1 Tax=Nocardia sp. NPDC050712 TaxID=3155518 RepID=UPI0033D6A7B2
MDSLIWIGLLATWVVMFQQRSRRVQLALWWITLLATALLLRHHISSGLGLGLTW